MHYSLRTLIDTTLCTCRACRIITCAHNLPQVDRSEVDSYTSGTVLQGFELKLRWTQPDRPPESFNHALKLHGAKGEIHFNLCIDPGMTMMITLTETNSLLELHLTALSIETSLLPVYKYSHLVLPPNDQGCEPKMPSLSTEVVAGRSRDASTTSNQLHPPLSGKFCDSLLLTCCI